jgi:hypothetical protein
MAEGDDYTQDADLMDDIDTAKAYGGKDEVTKHGTDLHVLVAAQADRRAISNGLDYPNFAAFLDAKDDDGMTPLMLAAEGLFGDAAKDLYEAGADVMLKNKKGETALDIFNRAYARSPSVLGNSRAEQEDTAQWIRGFLWDKAADARVRKANAEKIAMVSVGKQIPYDITRKVLGPMVGVTPTGYTPQSAKGRKTRVRKTKRRSTRRRR